jgi:hypothetical protein
MGAFRDFISHISVSQFLARRLDADAGVAFTEGRKIYWMVNQLNLAQAKAGAHRMRNNGNFLSFIFCDFGGSRSGEKKFPPSTIV